MQAATHIGYDLSVSSVPFPVLAFSKLPATVYQAASRLAANSNVVARIRELRQAVTDIVVANVAWTKKKLKVGWKDMLVQQGRLAWMQRHRAELWMNEHVLPNTKKWKLKTDKRGQDGKV